MGLGAGNNVGIKAATTDYVFILNPDVTLESNTLDELFLASKKLREFTILSPFNVDLDYTIDLVDKLKKKFLDDVKLFSKWDHPNLVSIHYFDVDEVGIPYYVMEYVPKTLGHWIGLVNDETDEALETRSESFPQQESIEIIFGICRGLDILHNEGIGHYRISPNNVLITQEGTPKLVSFGIETGMRPELASKIQRKYAGIYSAPEQIRGDHNSIGPKSDMYTIGLLFFQLLTG